MIGFLAVVVAVASAAIGIGEGVAWVTGSGMAGGLTIAVLLVAAGIFGGSRAASGT